MNKVLGLRYRFGSKQLTAFKRKSIRPTTRNVAQPPASVFIALPGKKPFSLLTAQAPESVFVVLPQKAYHGPRRENKKGLKTKSVLSAAALSLVCFIGIIFVAIGMLNLMIRSFKLQAYAQGTVALEQAAHKPGAGPAPQDAVINEYQHALTREMVAAADTTMVATAGNGPTKGMLEQITIAEELDSAAISGALRKVKIYNGTTKTLDRIVIQVDILNSAGHLLRTEYHTAKRIASMGTKVFELDEPAPGAQIHCSIQEVRSKTLRTSLRAL